MERVILLLGYKKIEDAVSMNRVRNGKKRTLEGLSELDGSACACTGDP